MLPAELVREFAGKESISDTSNSYITVPTLPVAAAFATCRVGLRPAMLWPPTGDIAAGTASDGVPGAGPGFGDGLGVVGGCPLLLPHATAKTSTTTAKAAVGRTIVFTFITSPRKRCGDQQ